MRSRTTDGSTADQVPDRGPRIRLCQTLDFQSPLMRHVGEVMTSALTCSSHLSVQLFYLSVWLHPRRPDTLLLLWSATSCLLTTVPSHVLKRWQNLCESSNFAFVFLFVFLFVCCMCAVTPPTSGPRLYSDSFLDLSSKPPPPVFSLDLSSSVWAPCPLSPSHRIGCYSGLDLVLVGGAGILMAGMANAPYLSAWHCLFGV